MCVDVSHFVLVTLCDTDDEVVDDGLDSAKGSDIPAAAVVDLDGDDVFLREGETDSEVREVLCEFAY